MARGRVRAAEQEIDLGLVISLSVIALGGLAVTGGGAMLYVENGATDRLEVLLILGGVLLVLGGAAGARARLRGLPPCESDCARYGRYMLGLAYLLLVLGFCNGLGTSILALNGSLGFSAASLMRASDPAQIEKADKERNLARQDQIVKDRAISDARRDQLRAEQAVLSQCAGAFFATSREAPVCSSARAKLLDVQDEVIRRTYDYDLAYEQAKAASDACETARAQAREALFFLLSISTMMSLFGATFYVVNRVRDKRPVLTDDEEVDGAARQTSARDELTAAEPTTAGARSATKRLDPESFDLHTFWSGALFRVGEAMLFTFALFWTIWTLGDRSWVVWLPVLGLFVGMFVKTGEVIVFQLGERMLLATRNFLPPVQASEQQAPPVTKKIVHGPPG